jgi:hypothetical protein
MIIYKINSYFLGGLIGFVDAWKWSVDVWVSDDIEPVFVFKTVKNDILKFQNIPRKIFYTFQREKIPTRTT